MLIMRKSQLVRILSCLDQFRLTRPPEFPRITRLAKGGPLYLRRAKVRVECRNFTTGVVSYRGTGTTDEKGTEVKEGRDRARIMLTHNSLGFLKDVPLPTCGQFLLQYAMADEE
ncbi:hypothetical protein QJS10_CPB17g00808 [Acorus calamus]|uniref:Uncharacterized protein n=1 Tax=Acorus calamus TaxID=4465 RepID=A0AAV9CXW5_ACOCL|nr:hypothetical protein QJS10_CPB17g00808 [Acorus calamus]